MSRSRDKASLGTRIRPGGIADAQQLAELFTSVRSTMTYLPNLHSQQKTCDYFLALVSRHESFVVLGSSGLLGFAIFGNGWLHHLYVRERGRGIGTMLLDEVKRRSHGGLQLWTFQANRGARRFYQRQGFVVAEETDGQENEERLPDVRYVWTAASV